MNYLNIRIRMFNVSDYFLNFLFFLGRPNFFLVLNYSLFNLLHLFQDSINSFMFRIW